MDDNSNYHISPAATFGALYALNTYQQNARYNEIVSAFIAQGMNSQQARVAADQHFGIDRNRPFITPWGWVSIAVVVIFLIGCAISASLGSDEPLDTLYCAPGVVASDCPVGQYVDGTDEAGTKY